MNGETAATPMGTVHFLTSYRDVTQKLYQLVRTATSEDVPLDAVNSLLENRDQLIESFGGRKPDLSEEGVEALLADIQQMEQVVSVCLQALMRSTQEKMHGFQEKKRGAIAYQNEYASNAVFFDRKK